MKINKLLFFIFLYISIIYTKSYSAENKSGTFEGKGGAEDHSFLNVTNSNLKKGKDFFKQALKLKKKNKVKKSGKKFEKALSYFVLAHKEYPENVEILNYLGFTYNVIGDLMMSEIYYQQALVLDPKNPAINQGLGELYLETKRINLAKERLEALSICNCQEYTKLKNLLEKN